MSLASMPSHLFFFFVFLFFSKGGCLRWEFAWHQLVHDQTGRIGIRPGARGVQGKHVACFVTVWDTSYLDLVRVDAASKFFDIRDRDALQSKLARPSYLPSISPVLDPESFVAASATLRLLCDSGAAFFPPCRHCRLVAKTTQVGS